MDPKVKQEANDLFNKALKMRKEAGQHWLEARKCLEAMGAALDESERCFQEVATIIKSLLPQ